MAVHIFDMDKVNYKNCKKRGIVGLPKTDSDETFDALLSRLAMINENDYILMFINYDDNKKKSKTPVRELRGVWQADSMPFYDENALWTDDDFDNNKTNYPFRCRIKTSDFCFDKPLLLNDIRDLLNNNKIWTWALNRPSGYPNAMFSISNEEFEIMVNEFLKINPFSQKNGELSNLTHIMSPTSLKRCARVTNPQ